MAKFERYSTRVPVCMVLLVMASVAAHAQGAVSYAFLEVVDRANKPVALATVDVAGSCVGEQPQVTDEAGHLKNGVPIGFGDCDTHDFTVSKPGYYPFRDVGLFHFRGMSMLFNEHYGTGSRTIKNIRVGLIAIPKGKAAD